MNDLIRISAKNLGALALLAACQRCLWLKLRLNHRLPFQIFPGIFSSIDAYTKRVVHACFDEHDGPPSWLSDLGPIVGYRDPPHFTHFNYVDTEHNILLTGMPDGILVRSGRSHIIVDYKTAKFTATQDKLFPMYEIQLNAYAAIGQRCGFKPVTGLALIYMEPMTNGRGRLHRRCREYGFDMGFSAHVLPVDLNTELLSPLLARTRELSESPGPPTGRPGCKDCKLTDRLVGLVIGEKVANTPKGRRRRAVKARSSRSESAACRG